MTNAYLYGERSVDSSEHRLAPIFPAANVPDRTDKMTSIQSATNTSARSAMTTMAHVVNVHVESIPDSSVLDFFLEVQAPDGADLMYYSARPDNPYGGNTYSGSIDDLTEYLSKAGAFDSEVVSIDGKYSLLVDENNNPVLVDQAEFGTLENPTSPAHTKGPEHEDSAGMFDLVDAILKAYKDESLPVPADKARYDKLLERIKGDADGSLSQQSKERLATAMVQSKVTPGR